MSKNNPAETHLVTAGRTRPGQFLTLTRFAVLVKHLSVHLLMGCKDIRLLALRPALPTSFDEALGSQQSPEAARLSVCPSPLMACALSSQLWVGHGGMQNRRGQCHLSEAPHILLYMALQRPRRRVTAPLTLLRPPL